MRSIDADELRQPYSYQIVKQVELTDECIQKIAERTVELIKNANMNLGNISCIYHKSRSC